MGTSAILTQEETIVALRSKCALLEASLKKADTEARKSTLDAVTTVFGRGPGNVLAPLTMAEEVLEWVEEVFTITKQLAEEEKPYNLVRIKTLSGLGRYVAADYLNLIGGEKEQMEKSIEAVAETRGAA